MKSSKKIPNTGSQLPIDRNNKQPNWKLIENPADDEIGLGEAKSVPAGVT